jgi:hypothetical protein
VRAAGGIGEVHRQADLQVGQFRPQIAFQINDRSTPQRPAAVAQVDLVVDFVVRRAEAGAQQFGHVAPQRLVTRPSRHGTDDFG